MTFKIPFVLRICLLSLALLFLASLVPGSIHTSAMSSNEMWQDTTESVISGPSERTIVPQRYRLLQANETILLDRLKNAPAENSPAAFEAPAEITLPIPDGTFQRFRVVSVQIMAPELAARYPQITTYRAVGLDDPSAYAILDHTPAGFHAMILSSSDTVFIDPYRKGDTRHYISYYRGDFLPPADKTFIFNEPIGDPNRIRDLVAQMGPNTASGNTLRTYRTAIAATGEYTTYHGGTVPNGMAAIVTSLNRVTGVYEREVAVRMVLVANNDAIVFTDPTKDPYTNEDGFAMLEQNQTTIDSLIGDANYDIGHVFSTGGGGVAYLGVPCTSGIKAQGVTGSSNPEGDPYDIDYVAHEMGHQFGANHTFNSVTGSCGGGNRNASTAYEPGSASTIMGYAGICGADDIQPHSDDDFHTISFDEIIAYTTLYNGDTCAVKTSTGNQAPTVEAGTGGFSIPKGTPFRLTGSGSDPDGDAITFSWEEFDLGPAGSPNSPSGNAPIFRSFSPENSPTRTFPKMSDIVNNTHTIGELLPSYGRSLTFRLTVRDNHTQPSAGGVAYDTIAFNVTNNAGPFAVTAPNSAVTWLGYEARAVTWNVANTNLAPVNCANVNIVLSTDGGYTYPTPLASATPNDGNETIFVPNAATTTARIGIFCATNIFFDISNANFTIQANSLPPASFSKAGPTDHATDISISPTLSWNASSGASGYEYCFDTTDNDLCDSTWISATVNTSVEISGLSSSSIYFWQVRAMNPNGSTEANSAAWWQFTTLSVAPDDFGKLTPANGASDLPVSLTLAWETSAGAASYEYCLDTSDDDTCDAPWISAGTQISVTISDLAYATNYFWQVRAINNDGSTEADQGAWWHFTTQASPPAGFGKISPADDTRDIISDPTISWESSAGATSYEYCYHASDDDACDHASSWVSSGTYTSVTLSGLDNGVTYYWQVRALNSSGSTYADDDAWWYFAVQTRIYLPLIMR